MGAVAPPGRAAGEEAAGEELPPQAAISRTAIGRAASAGERREDMRALL